MDIPRDDSKVRRLSHGQAASYKYRVKVGDHDSHTHLPGLEHRVAHTPWTTFSDSRGPPSPCVSDPKYSHQPTNKDAAHTIAPPAVNTTMDALRSALQPITHNLPAPLVETGRSLIGPVCYKTLVVDIDPFRSPECLKLAISKGLGIGIIAASSIVKIPQLLKILNAQSADGISFLTYVLESGSYMISLAYNFRHGFPFSTYGETSLILVQNIVIASLVLKFGGRGVGSVGAWLAGLVALGSALLRPDIVDVKTLGYLQVGAGVLTAASKLPQIWTVYQQGGTGQLSAFAVSFPKSLCTSVC